MRREADNPKERIVKATRYNRNKLVYDKLGAILDNFKFLKGTLYLKSKLVLIEIAK